MPSSARLIMVSSTSLTISGSSAEVGSSNSMIFGVMHSARAIATRCCWPPESWLGYLCACSGMRTRVRYFIAIASASSCLRPREWIGASVQFCRMVRCGNRLNCWNTMPTSSRTEPTLRPPALRSMPLTTMRPFCTVSRWLMQRISVDLPEPEGPQTTMRSPARTFRLMSVSTWNLPNHLSTPSMRMMGSIPAADGAGEGITSVMNTP